MANLYWNCINNKTNNSWSIPRLDGSYCGWHITYCGSICSFMYCIWLKNEYDKKKNIYSFNRWATSKALACSVHGRVFSKSLEYPLNTPPHSSLEKTKNSLSKASPNTTKTKKNNNKKQKKKQPQKITKWPTQILFKFIND